MGEKEEMNFYDYSELLEKNSEGIEPNNIEEKPKDTKANFFKRKKPEELELSDLIELLKIEVETDSEKAKPHMYELIRLLETDEKYFWHLTGINVANLIQYAGYHKEDDIYKAYINLRSIEKFKEYKERRRKQILSKLKSKVGRIIGSKNNETTQKEQKASEESQQDVSENATNDSNDRDDR